MITCKTATDFISKKEEGKLSKAELRSLWFHLLICRVCKRFDIQNSTITTTLRRMSAGSQKLSSNDKDEIIRKMEQNNND